MKSSIVVDRNRSADLGAFPGCVEPEGPSPGSSTSMGVSSVLPTSGDASGPKPSIDVFMSVEHHQKCFHGVHVPECLFWGVVGVDGPILLIANGQRQSEVVWVGYGYGRRRLKRAAATKFKHPCCSLEVWGPRDNVAYGIYNRLCLPCFGNVFVSAGSS